MKVQKQFILRSVFYIVVFGVFLFQMRNSVCKYFSVPIIQERFTKLFTEIQPPIVFICQDSRVRLTEIPNTRQVFGPTDTDLNMYDLSYFEIIYTMHDRSLYNGKSCLSYEEIGSSYGDCIENVMKVELLKVYGCLPPWFVNTKGLTCEEEKDITVDWNLLENLSEDMYNIAYGTDLDIFNVCKQPCVSFSASMTRTSYRSNLPNTSWFGFKGN